VCHVKESPDDVAESFHVAQQVQKDIGVAVHAGDMEVFSVSYISSSIAIQMVLGVSCDARKACLTFFAAINQCCHIFQGVQ
jgi:hypothetical protein